MFHQLFHQLSKRETWWIWEVREESSRGEELWLMEKHCQKRRAMWEMHWDVTDWKRVVRWGMFAGVLSAYWFHSKGLFLSTWLWTRKTWRRSLDCMRGSSHILGLTGSVLLRWLGTVLGLTESANFFVKTYCLWHKHLEIEILLGVAMLDVSENGPNIAIFDLRVRVKTVTCCL